MKYPLSILLTDRLFEFSGFALSKILGFSQNQGAQCTGNQPGYYPVPLPLPGSGQGQYRCCHGPT